MDADFILTGQVSENRVAFDIKLATPLHDAQFRGHSFRHTGKPLNMPIKTTSLRDPETGRKKEHESTCETLGR